MGASLMATGYLVDGGHAHDDEPQAQLDGSTFIPREKVRSATLRRRWIILWRPARHGAKLTYRPVMEAHGVVLDSLRRRVQVDGYVVHLSARETAVLRALMIRAGRVVYRPVLAAAAWGGDIEADHCSLDRLLGRLRRRLQPSPLSPARLHRVGDASYLFGSRPDLDLKPPL
jgi:DNA-binding response OmpR family regulator